MEKQFNDTCPYMEVDAPNSRITRPSVRVHWVACGTCSVPGNFFQVGVCSRYNARSDWLIVTGPRADYGLAKINHIINYLLTELARAVLGNIGPRSWQYGPSAARSVQKRPRARGFLINDPGPIFPSTALALG